MDLIVVLCVETDRILEEVSVSVAKVAIGIVRSAEQQFLDRVADQPTLGIGRNAASVSGEVARHQSGPGAVPKAVGICTLIVDTELDGVVALHPGIVLR